MIKFSPGEVSLCKQVAEKHRKEIGEGDWYISKDSDYKAGWSPPLLNEDDYEPIKSKLVGIYDDKDRNDVPLWTISDCLEFLEEKGYGRIISFIHFDNGYWTFTAENIITSNNYKKARGEKANTKLEACLKAVLAMLEEGK